MKISIDYQRCKQCGLCIHFCPKKVFDKAVDGSPVPVRESECVDCRQCVLRCPDLAIELSGGKNDE